MEPLLVLLVDDDLRWCEATAETLREHGYRVETAHTGLDALEFIERQLPDAIILDIQLPDISGLDVLDRMRSRGLSVPTVVISAEDTALIMSRALDAGASAILRKPTGMEWLLKALAHLTARKSCSECSSTPRRNTLQ